MSSFFLGRKEFFSFQALPCLGEFVIWGKITGGRGLGVLMGGIGNINFLEGMFLMCMCVCCMGECSTGLAKEKGDNAEKESVYWMDGWRWFAKKLDLNGDLEFGVDESVLHLCLRWSCSLVDGWVSDRPFLRVRPSLSTPCR